MAGYSTVTRFRRGLFWITVTLFFTTWPLLLMHTFGVEFDPDEERLVQRAAVWAVSRPSGATIFVDGREHDRPTPALVSGLEEGVHEIELRLEGHRPWRASLTTEENRVLELDAALLVPDEPVVESLSLTAPFVRLLVLGTHLVVVRETLADWSAHDIDAPGAVAARGPAERHDPDLVVERLDHPPYLDHALVLARDGDRRMPMLVSVRPGGIELDRLDVSLPDGARMVWHAPMIGSTLFQAHDRLLVYRSPLDDLSELEPSVAGSGYLDGSFYYVTRERIVRVTPLGVRATVTQFAELDEAVAEEIRVFLSRGPVEVVYADDETVAFLSPDGTLFVHFNGHVRRIAVAGAAGDTDEQRLLLWQVERTGAIDLRLASANGITDDVSRELVIEWGAPVPGELGAPIAIPEVSHLLYRGEGALVAAIVAPGVKSEPREVIRVVPEEEARFVRAAGVVALVDRETGTVRLVDLVPEEPLLSIERLE